MLSVDGVKFKYVSPTKDYQKILIAAIKREYRIEVILLKKLNKKKYNMAFVLKSMPNKVFLLNNLTEKEFNYCLFHEVRHIQQGRMKSHILYVDKNLKCARTLVRYLYDCLLCEIDADLYSIRECNTRQLPHSAGGYLYESNAKLEQFLASNLDFVPQYKVTKKQIKLLSNTILRPLRRMR